MKKRNSWLLKRNTFGNCFLHDQYSWLGHLYMRLYPWFRGTVNVGTFNNPEYLFYPCRRCLTKNEDGKIIKCRRGLLEFICKWLKSIYVIWPLLIKKRLYAKRIS